MSAVLEVNARKDRPAYVRFERVAFEDKAASVREGRYVARDVDMAFITPPYSKDIYKVKVAQWLQNLALDVANGRLPQQWADDYRQAYERWKRGEEIPLNGAPIKGWGILSPAQQESLIHMNVLTVEDLAAINDEGIKRIGMGGADLKTKAQAWLAQLRDKGPLTQEMAALKAENSLLKASVETLTRQVGELLVQAKALQGFVPQPQPQNEGIAAADILDAPAEKGQI